MRAYLLAGAAALATTPAVSAQNSPAGGFNPAISLTVMGQYADYGRDPESFALPGFPLGGEAHLKPEGFSLDHTELTLSADIDVYFYGQVGIALHQHDGKTEIELEEAFVETLALPAGLSLRLGRFAAAFGYHNPKHPHAWDFVDAPLPAMAFLGGGWFDDGLRLSWLAPADTYLELGGELFRGSHYPATAGDKAIGAYTLFARTGGDVGHSHSWQAGVSGLWTRPRDRDSGHHHGHGHGHDHHDHDHHDHGGADEAFAFSGDSRLWGVDLVWKWAPEGNARQRQLVLQTEYFERRESGRVANDDASETSRYRGRQRGWYGQAIYRFLPRWRAGLRHDRLWSDNRGSDEEVLEEAGLADAGRPLWRNSAMLEFSPSEFSRLRLQYTHDRTAPESDHQWLLQYVMHFGAHGAHSF